MNKLIVGFVALIIAFIFEHVTRLHNIPNISYVLRELAYWSREAFYQIGLAFSHLSSFLNLIEFQELVLTLKELWKPTIELLTSPLESIRGYIDAALEYAHPSWVLGGSAIITVIVWVAWRKYRKLPLIPKLCDEAILMYESGVTVIVPPAPGPRSNSRGRNNN